MTAATHLPHRFDIALRRAEDELLAQEQTMILALIGACLRVNHALNMYVFHRSVHMTGSNAHLELILMPRRLLASLALPASR